MTTLRSPEGGKRRRRSVQPVVQSRRRRRLWIVLGLSVVSLVLAGYFGFRFYQRNRLEGETFRDGVNRRISEALGCQVEFNRIYDGGDESLAAKEARFEVRDPGDLIQSGTFSNLSASLTGSSWVTDEWGILMLNINEGTITLNPSRPDFPNDSTGIVPHSGGGRHVGGFGINPEPERITLDEVRFLKGLTVEWPASSGAGQTTEAIKKLRGHAKIARSGGMSGTFIDGSVALNQMPEMRIQNLNWKLSGRKLDVAGGSIKFGGRAQASVSGKADLVSDGSAEFTADFESTPLATLLPPAWHEAVLGLFSAQKTTFRASFGKGPERVFEGDFKVVGAIFQGFTFFDKASEALGRNVEVQRPEFPVLTGHFKWSPSTGLELTNLFGERGELLRMSGSVTLTESGPVKGRLKLSTSENALRNVKKSAPQLFGPFEDGWASFEFNVSGTAKAIVDDIDLKTAARGPDSPAPDGAASTPSPTQQVPAAPQNPAAAPAPNRRAPAPAPSAPPRPKPSNAELEKQMEDLLRANKSAPR